MSYLKIKDNVDLKELEKFGFENAEFNEFYMIKYIPDNIKKGWRIVNETMEYYRTLYVDKSNKKIVAYNDYLDSEIQMQRKWIKDLIKAGLVEELEDERN